MTIWLTGLSSSGKSTIAARLVEHLRRHQTPVEWLDGDALRQTLCRGLGFTRQDRDENVARITYVAECLTRHGVTVVVSAISPYSEARQAARATIGRFLEVFVDAPLEVCETRDEHGVYRRARLGQLHHVTGIDDPYEAPESPEVHCRTDRESVEACVEKILAARDTIQHRWISHADKPCSPERP